MTRKTNNNSAFSEMQFDEDDDDTNDPDYNPIADANFEEIDDSYESSNSKLVGISYATKRKVEDIWQELVDSDRKVLNDSSKRHLPINIDSITTTTKVSKKKIDKNERILASIFGATEARIMLKKPIESQSQNTLKDSKSSSITETARESLREAVKNLKKKQKVTEVRKFAGQEVTVEKTIIDNSNKSVSKSLGSNTTSSLDAVLDTIKGPKSISTVGKSAMDWENYKESEGLQDELSVAQKEG